MKRADWTFASALLVVGMACGRVEAARAPVEEYQQIVPSPGQNMIENGDFERDSDGDGMPDEWGRIEYWLPTTKVDAKRVQVSEGNHALQIEFLTDGGCVINYLLGEKRRYLRPSGPTWIYHALRVKHEGHGIVYGHAIDANFRAIGSTSRATKPGDWCQLGKVYRYDPALHDGIAMVRIYIQYAQAGDRYWIDDYVLRAMTEEEAKERLAGTTPPDQKKWEVIPADEADTVAEVKKGNILRDSSFESNPDYCRVRDGMKWWADGGRACQGRRFSRRVCDGGAC
ncbi:MAG: hypothetical protein V2A58_05655 [Planctomycetota bacterium]